jgi:hypothetical protein
MAAADRAGQIACGGLRLEGGAVAKSALEHMAFGATEVEYDHQGTSEERQGLKPAL